MYIASLAPPLNLKGHYPKKCKWIVQCYGNKVTENLDSKLSSQAERENWLLGTPQFKKL